MPGLIGWGKVEAKGSKKGVREALGHGPQMPPRRFRHLPLRDGGLMWAGARMREAGVVNDLGQGVDETVTYPPPCGRPSESSHG